MNQYEQDSETGRRRFRIAVDGRLGDRFVEGIDEVEIRHSPEGSTLDGVLIDQSHLRGILDRLWQLGIEVRRFETYLAHGPSQTAARNDT